MKERVNIKINKSKIYFTPLFNQCLKISYFKLLMNTYFFYDDFREETFCLLYKFDGRLTGGDFNREGFTIYERDVLMESPYFRGFKDFDNGLVLYEFDLTDELLEYRNILLEGKYSQLPELAKETIIEFNRRMYGPNDSDFIRRVLYKDPMLIQAKAKDLGYPMRVRGKLQEFPQDAEAISVINPENEMFANFVELKEEENDITRVSEGSIKD